MDIPIDRYINAHDRVVEVMDSVREPLLEEIADRIDNGEEWTQEMRDRALDYARIYALRDVMTLMDCGKTLDEAFEMWKTKPDYLGIEGACIDSAQEVWDDFNDDEDWDDEDEEEEEDE